MNDALTRLAFRVQGGDVEAARMLLVAAREKQNAGAFERAAKALHGGPSVLETLEKTISPGERSRVRALLPSALEASAMFTPRKVDVEAIERIGPSALVVISRWAIEGLRLVPRYGTGRPYLGAGVAGPWLQVVRAFAGRVEAPWLAVRAVVEVDPAKKALTEAIVKGYFAIFLDRAPTPAQIALAHESPPARKALWAKLVADHAARVDDASLCALLDDPTTRDLAMAILVRRGKGVVKHALPYLHSSAPGTRRAVAGLLAVVGDDAAVAELRQAIARERDARARVQMTSAIEKLSGAEPLVPKTKGEDQVVSRARGALTAPRKSQALTWLVGLQLGGLRWRDGEPVTQQEIRAIASLLSTIRTDDTVDPLVPDLAAALDPEASHALFAEIRDAFVRSHERQVLPDWYLRAAAQFLSERHLDAMCEELDRNLRSTTRDLWRREASARLELVWDPDAIASSPCRSAFAWLSHWAETGPKRRDREKAQRALAVASRAVPEAERPFAVLRRFGLDDEGARRFEDGDEALVVRVVTGGAIDVLGAGDEALLRLPSDDLGARVKKHVVQLEEALLAARRTLAEAYADRLSVDVGFVRGFLLRHPLWRPIAQGCVVRHEGGKRTLRVSDETLATIEERERVRFVLAQVEG